MFSSFQHDLPRLSLAAPIANKVIPIIEYPRKNVNKAFWGGAKVAKIEEYEGRGWVYT